MSDLMERSPNQTSVITTADAVDADTAKDVTGSFDYGHMSSFTVCSETTATLSIYRWMLGKWWDTGFTISVGSAVAPATPSNDELAALFSASRLLLSGASATVGVDVKG